MANGGGASRIKIITTKVSKIGFAFYSAADGIGVAHPLVGWLQLNFTFSKRHTPSVWQMLKRNCRKYQQGSLLASIIGLEYLKSLRRLFMGSCTASASAVKSRLSKVTLRNLNSFCVPGSEIPDWFSQKAVIFTPRPNITIKNIIVAVVVSVDLQKLDKAFAKQPVIVGIRAQILRKNTPMPIISTTLILSGVPRNVEDQLYLWLCRYKDYHPLVLLLRGGDTVHVIQEQGAIADGVELKKWGIFLVFENDDDYDGDEDLLPIELQSVTQRLACYYQSL